MSNPYLNKKLLSKAQRKARKIGVRVKPYKGKGKKKLDVFDKDGKKVGSIGSILYEDFNIHKDKKRRALYKKRHNRYRHIKNTNSYFSDKILW